MNGATGYVSKAYLSSDAPTQTAPETQAAQATDGTGTDGTGTDGNTGGEANGTANTNTGDNTQQQENTAAPTQTAQTSVSGTVIGTTPDSITLQGDDGNTYSVYYGDANMNSADGIYDGVYVSINLDSSQASGDGTLYATDVTGY